jgi:deoxyribodipyrimidine photolyase-related protein
LARSQTSGNGPAVWILGNQLHKDHPALQAGQDANLDNKPSVLMIESQRLLESRPWHPWKRVLVLSAMRHYANQLRRAGYWVDYLQAESFQGGISQHIKEYQSTALICMASSNYHTRRFQETILPANLDIPVQILPNNQFLVEAYNPYPKVAKEKNIRQESFYRRLRRHYHVLMDPEGEPLGGQWNYDAQNRKPLPSNAAIPKMLSFPPDQITQEVIREVKSLDPNQNPEGFSLAVDHTGAAKALDDFLENRLADFGTYEDAMTIRSKTIYHSLLSPYLNLGLLDPLEVIQAAEKAYHQGSAPLNSVEGFIRQILGWREYMYWQYWRLFPDLSHSNHLKSNRDLPEFFWSGITELNCLSVVLQGALDTGYNHHIERLMVLSNFCTLTGIQPVQVLDWFMAIFVDAYPWVMAPNVIGMGLYADGGRIGTKPYISSANYINKMSDYCQDCRYNHQRRTGDQACPYNYLYWNFLLEHESELRSNPRMNLPLANLTRLDSREQQQIQKQAKSFMSSL